ncbi:MAG: glutamate--tRNA ligase family protein, partial [Fibrobacteria bacterium]
MKTRLAPTPSGFLHAGNAWSFVLTWLLARSQGGTVRLRIDDLDTARFRDGYGEDIFASLRWLGLDWDTGPRTVAEVKGIYSQQSRLGKYRAALEALAGREEAGGPLIYACACSREQVKRAAGASGRPGVYPGTCRDKAIAWRENFGHPHPALDNHPLRARVPS